MGKVLSVIDEMFPPKPRFSVDDIPDLTGKVAIVTGSNTGIGKETVKALLQHNAKVYLAVRSKDRAEEAIRELKDATGKEAIFLELDLSDLRSVKRAVETFQSRESALHMLFNNAGVMTPPLEQLTAQGYDLQFGINVLGHFYFTKLLIPTLISTAKSSSPDGKARIINTSSSGSMGVTGVNYATLGNEEDQQAATLKERRSLGPLVLYWQSKFGNVLVSNELARRYGGEGIVSVSLNPGNLKSDLTRNMGRVAKAILSSFLLYPTPMGALTQLWAGTSDEGAKMNGKYLIPWARYGEPNPVALDQKVCEELWEWLEAQVGKFEEEEARKSSP